MPTPSAAKTAKANTLPSTRMPSQPGTHLVHPTGMLVRSARTLANDAPFEPRQCVERELRAIGLLGRSERQGNPQFHGAWIIEVFGHDSNYGLNAAVQGNRLAQ